VKEIYSFNRARWEYDLLTGRIRTIVSERKGGEEATDHRSPEGEDLF
jgi:hypothetical protein